MPYVDVAGSSCYYEQHGAGEPVMLLHGGFCSAETWTRQIDALAERFEVHVMERPGHGRSADREGPITFDAMVTDTIAYLDAFGLASAHVVGFSDGGITGLLLALRHPDRVRSLVSISANLSPDAFDPGGEDAPDPGPPSDEADPAVAEGEEEDEEWATIRAAYDRLSPDGPEHGDAVLAKLVAMWETEPNIALTDLDRISAPTLVMAGDQDSIPLDHTMLIARSIRGAQLCIVPGAGHLVAVQKPDLVNAVVHEFLADVENADQ